MTQVVHELVALPFGDTLLFVGDMNALIVDSLEMGMMEPPTLPASATDRPSSFGAHSPPEEHADTPSGCWMRT